MHFCIFRKLFILHPVAVFESKQYKNSQKHSLHYLFYVSLKEKSTRKVKKFVNFQGIFLGNIFLLPFLFIMFTICFLFGLKR